MVQRRLTRLVAAGVGVTCLALGAALVDAGGARAGVYHVYSCRTPSGAVAPTEGWTGTEGSSYDYATNTCANGGSLTAALGDETSHATKTDKAMWMFTPPTWAGVVGATLWRAGDNGGEVLIEAEYEFYIAGPSESEGFSECLSGFQCNKEGDLEQPLSVVNRLVVPSNHLGTHLYMIAGCGGTSGETCPAGKGDANGYAAAVYLYAADLTLEQTSGPSASNVSGELTAAPAVRGTSDVAFDASDPGAGVYQAVFTVDGTVVQRTVVDENGGRCVNVGGTSDGAPAFLHLQPCKPSVSVDVPFDTTRVGDGAHHLVVSVTDAAGNSAPVLDREITVANPPPAGAPNGANASAQATLVAAWTGSRKARITSAYGRSAHTIAGRLTAPGGAPIAGARIDCTATSASQGAKPIAIACPHTGQDGRFSVRVPGDAGSRAIRLAYRAHLGDALPAATRTLGLTVRAGVRLRVTPRVTSVGNTIHFTGMLLGGPVPRGGKQLVLEARSPGGPWIEFDVVRSDPRGRYRDSYTFKFPGPVDYRFRALSESEADYPYATGASNVVRVHES